MSGNDYVQKRPPSPSRKVVNAEHYRAAFYPGFVRRLTVVRGDTEVVLFEQQGSFVLPAGETKPWASCGVDFSGGPGHREIGLQVYDPRHEIARIEVVFKRSTEGGEDGGGEGGDGGEERLVIEDAAILCPPTCPD
jgi:hypothetical protein